MWFKKKNKDEVKADKKSKSKSANTKSKAKGKDTKSKSPTTKVKTIPATKKPAEKKEPTNTYYLTTRKDSAGKKIGWEVKKGNAAKVSAVCKTKEEAKAKVKTMAKNQSSTVIIYKMDGSIDETYKIN
ncbi:MAG: DUF2188 domain-containing protein [Mycoplasma sp.]